MIWSPRTIRFTKPPVAISLVPRDPGNMQAILAAREEGRRIGYEEASQALNVQILEQRAQIANLQENTLRAITAQFDRLVEEMRSALPILAMEIVRRLLGGTELDASHIQAITNDTLKEIAPGTTGVKLRLCPTDLDMIQDLIKEFDQKYPGLELVADPSLHSGDCVASSHFGTIDARLSGKLSNIANSLL